MSKNKLLDFFKPTNPVDKTFQDLLSQIFTNQSFVNTRNSTTLRSEGLRAEFISTPLLTVRKTAWKTALREMEWFLTGSSNINDLHESVRHWWTPWADKDGEIANNYGKQLRKFEGNQGFTDQVAFLLKAVKEHPFGRRNVITTWHTHDMLKAETPITNCHGTVIQVMATTTGDLNMIMYQRSADMIVGVQHNWIQYWALLLWLCTNSHHYPGKFIWVGGDCHIYEDHLTLAKKIINTKAVNPCPKLVYTAGHGKPFCADDFVLDGEYKPVLTDRAKMIV